MGQDVFNVVHGEHDAAYAQRVRRCVSGSVLITAGVWNLVSSAGRGCRVRIMPYGREVVDHGSFRAQLSRSGTGSSGHKITARSAASWMTELSSSARASATSYSSQDTTKVTGPAGGSG